MIARPNSATGRALAVAVVAGLALAAGGCGHQQVLGSPHLPLVPGARVVKRLRRCDAGSKPFCAIQMVVSAPQLASSYGLLVKELHLLQAHGWSLQRGEVGQESTAISPHAKFRVTVATAFGELEATDLNWVQRAEEITLALSRTLFKRTPAIAILLTAGPS